jgi:bisphosphoglycerate-independent phosphoglycerate mutase (AlkP superfamily)
VKAHGTAVGLPSDDDMGNSEVGHNALGAGRIFAQGYDIYFQFILEIRYLFFTTV